MGIGRRGSGCESVRTGRTVCTVLAATGSGSHERSRWLRRNGMSLGWYWGQADTCATVEWSVTGKWAFRLSCQGNERPVTWVTSHLGDRGELGSALKSHWG